MRYRLRTLVIVLAPRPPVFAGAYFAIAAYFSDSEIAGGIICSVVFFVIATWLLSRLIINLHRSM
jgi:hypothetical protein